MIPESVVPVLMVCTCVCVCEREVGEGSKN